MHIAFLSSEVVPFSKTGGLADVSGSLPPALAALGHRVSVFTPFYRAARKADPGAEKVLEGTVQVGNDQETWSLYASTLVRGVYLLGHDGYFDREGLYGTRQGDFPDSIRRFAFFSKACLAAAEALGKPVDVYHAHDWQSALVPVYLRLALDAHPFHANVASLFTIHNLAYQGQFWHWDWPLLNLPWKHFNWKELEFYGKINLLKGALVYADVLNTVSPTYAKEIQTKENGCGLEGVLTQRREDLFGVVNGVDREIWNPASDPLLPAHFGAEELGGKAECKAELLKRFGLPVDLKTPVVGMVMRLIEQKGVELMIAALEELARRNMRLVILGTGEDKHQQPFLRMREVFPERLGVALAYDNALAHLIYAGSDLFLMPSRFEPCGLSQLYALAYGSVPIVRRTGGLADTVTDALEGTAGRPATGFVFGAFDAKPMLQAVDRALTMYAHDRDTFVALQRAGMRQDWSWARSAQAYVDLYERARGTAKQRQLKGLIA